MTSESTLNAGFASAIAGGGRWRPVLQALLVGALLGAAATEIARAGFPRAAAATETRAAAVEWPAREIPREWRWRGPSYPVERMFPRPRDGALR